METREPVPSGERLLSRLEQQCAHLEDAWTRFPDQETPPGLVGKTLARLRSEGLLEAERVRVDWRRRLAVGIGVAAALMIGLSLARFGDAGLSRLLPGATSDTPAWAADLVLAERFESPAEETEVRLTRIAELLEESGIPEDLSRTDAVDELRARMDRLAEDLEVF